MKTKEAIGKLIGLHRRNKNMDLIMNGDIEFFNEYFLRKVEKLEWNGVNDMAMNIIFSSFDCGMRLGYTWRDIVEEPLIEFKRRAEEIGKKEFEPLIKMAEKWNETGDI